MSAVIQADLKAESKTSTTTTQGTLGKHAVSAFADTESVTQGVNEFLGDINEPKQPEKSLTEFTFTDFNSETVKTETEISQLHKALEKTEPKKEPPKTQKPTQEPKQQKIHSSLFSLAHSFNKGLTEKRRSEQPAQKPLPENKQERTQARRETRSNQTVSFSSHEVVSKEMQLSDSRNEQQERDDEQKEGSGGQQDQQQQQEQQRKRKESFNVKASRKASRSRTSSNESGGSVANQTLGSVEGIFIRFMALMARILGQAEAEAHDLYMRIKERTDNIDVLTLLVSKINTEKGEIDWSEDEEMKQLVDRAREIGVEIPEGKYTWSEDEKKLLKENISMRKDSMEKVTQLERTDMQRYLQEASQCHQARSNVLKLLKEVNDTIIHNMRGG